jgi:hypothetical protein
MVCHHSSLGVPSSKTVAPRWVLFLSSMLMLTCKHPYSQTCEHRSGNVAIIGQGFEIHLLALEGDLFRVYLSRLNLTMQFGLLCYRNITTIAGTICTVVLSESSSKGKHDWGAWVNILFQMLSCLSWSFLVGKIWWSSLPDLGFQH